MKKLIIALTLLSVSFVSGKGNKSPKKDSMKIKIVSEDLIMVKKLGLISYLTLIKGNSENRLLKNCKGDDIKSKYLDLKVKTDMLINQFCADMIDRKGMSLYRSMNLNLNNEDKTEDRTDQYMELINKIDTVYSKLLEAKCIAPSDETMSLSGTPTEVLKLLGIEPYGLFKDIKANKKEKLEKLVGYIKGLTLKPLIEQKKAKEPEKETKTSNC